MFHLRNKPYISLYLRTGQEGDRKSGKLSGKQNDYAIRQANHTPEIGKTGQEKIGKAKVLIVGVGGLGSPVSLYLAGAGVGTIGLADDDTVGISNLQRQILYTEDDLEKPKAICAAERLSRLNSESVFRPHPVRLTQENAEEMIRPYDIVVDGCDNFATRYLIDDVCKKQGKPYVYGAICGFEGQVSVFHYGERKRAIAISTPMKKR